MKNTFYVLRSGFVRRGVQNLYVKFYSDPNLNTYTAPLKDATRFTSVTDALTALQERERDYAAKYPGSILSRDFTLIRVTENTTVGTRRRIEVPLGDMRKMGFVVSNGVKSFWTGKVSNGSDKYTKLLQEACVFTTLTNAIDALQRAVDLGMAPVATATIHAVAEETTPGAVTFDEVVLS